MQLHINLRQILRYISLLNCKFRVIKWGYFMAVFRNRILFLPIDFKTGFRFLKYHCIPMY